MISQEEGRYLAARQVGEGTMQPAGGTPMILDENTLELDFGWVFFYQSKEYLEHGDIHALLLGNAPVIVDRVDGTVHVTGTAYPIEHYVEVYRKARGAPGGVPAVPSEAPAAPGEADSGEEEV